MTIALVVYASRSGDDRRIAAAVADGCAERMPAAVLPAPEAPLRLGPDIGLLVVGGAHEAPEGTGLHQWLTDLSTTVPGIPTAAWDTQMGPSGPPAEPAPHSEERLLRLRGFDLVAPVEHFVVGPLGDGDEQRAREWGTRLGEMVGRRMRIPAAT